MLGMAQQCVTLGLLLSPPLTQPLPQTPKSASAGGKPPKGHLDEGSRENEKPNGRGKPKVHPLSPLPGPKARHRLCPLCCGLIGLESMGHRYRHNRNSSRRSRRNIRRRQCCWFRAGGGGTVGWMAIQT
ncbi:hypothetical protein BJY52DRAFT_1370408 [Lactarius psammicola]|nr:hypothetical protein BJY52DRAFT_1370408 [Lactarius psammicola]